MEQSNKKPTIIFALGGIEEIGKNMYIVEQNNELFIIDCGCKFCDKSELPGVDLIVCPFDYLVENKDKIKGLIITHGHEDHIGGAPYLLKTLEIPAVYGSSLSLAIIKRKCSEHSGIKKTEFIEIKDDTVIKTNEFEIDFFRVCHSIPLCYGLCMKTCNGNIVSTGDFRFDFSDKMEQTNIHKICEISKRGVDILLCETTNAESTGFSGSEALILDEIKRQILNAKGRVLMTTFASNLRRIENVIEIAINCGRKICLIGKSLQSNIAESVKIGLIKTYKQDFVEPSEIKNTEDKDLFIILTGSQGEENAALGMMANGQYPHLIFKPTDLLLFSSNPIPGNFASVENLVNLLTKCNIKILQNSSSMKLHASGHATQTELELMVSLVKPKYIVPIHGEYKMLRAMDKNVLFLGLKNDNFIQISNGQKVHLLDHVATATNEFVDTEEVYIEGLKMNIDNSRMLSARRIIGSDGIFNATIVLNRESKKMIGLPLLITRGCFYANSNLNLIKKICFSIKESIEKQMHSLNRPINNIEVRQIVESTIHFYVWRNKNKKPFVKTTVFDEPL